MPYPRILVVDDDDALRALFSELLEHEGFSVVLCPGVEAAIHELEDHPFDLVITDFQMLDGTGDMVVHAVSITAPNTPVLIVTGAPGAVPGSCLSEIPDVTVIPKLGSMNEVVVRAHEALGRRGVAYCNEPALAAVDERQAPPHRIRFPGGATSGTVS